MRMFAFIGMGLLFLASSAIASAQEVAPEENPAAIEPAVESEQEEASSEPAREEKPADETKPESESKPDPEVKPEEEKPAAEKEPTVDEKPADDKASPQEDKPDSERTPQLPVEIIPRDYLLLPAVGSYGKAAIHTDPIDYLLARGKWKFPTEGEEVESSSGAKRKWEAKQANEEGLLETKGIRGGYAVVEIDSPVERVMILQASGHAMVYVNGEPRTGDPYGYGWVELPILLQKGRNELMFQAAGETLSVKLTEPTAQIFFLPADSTLPDAVEGEAAEMWAAIPIVNATQEPFAGHVVSSIADKPPVASPLPTIPPLSVFKAPVKLPAIAAESGTKTQVKLVVHAGPVPSHPDDEKLEPTTSTPEVFAKAQLTIESVAAGKLQARTFRSAIDGSVQYYAALPAGGEDPTWEGPPGIVLSLHGESVDARKQAEFYEPKRWTHIIAPTNRRPNGFDWEDWGRIDALESLADAEQHFPNDPQRRYVTGHSMGGHGAWHLGVTYPGQIAAIGPSGGWPSYWSYGGGMPTFENPTSIEEMLLRGYSPSDTMTLLRNLTAEGVYLLHGENADERDVSVTQARFMRSRLGDFHPDFAYYEKPGAGHWWGKESVDWPWMMQFFRDHKLPAKGGPPEIDFTTANPGISARCHWATIEAQEKQLEPSRIVLDQTPAQRRVTGRTENVQRLMLDLSHFPAGRSAQVRLDGPNATRVQLPRGDDKRVWLAKQGDRWRQIPTPPQRLKGPHRYGTFKSAFNHRVMLVYGTKGSPEENRWAAAKARYDAETFWYRGNGAIEVVADTDFNPEDDRDASVILYGNSATNAAWPALMSLCPVQVRPSQISVGLRPESGDDLGAIFVWPRQGSDNALVGFVGGTGIEGMRLTNRLRYFVAGVAYPDLMVFGPKTLVDGTEDIRALGYFGNDWKVDTGEIVWRDVAL